MLMSFGKLMILMASYGHLFTHIPHPIHNYSEMKQMVEVGFTSTQILPILFLGQFLAHSYLHFFGLHLSGLMLGLLMWLEKTPNAIMQVPPYCDLVVCSVSLCAYTLFLSSPSPNRSW